MRSLGQTDAQSLRGSMLGKLLYGASTSEGQEATVRDVVSKALKACGNAMGKAGGKGRGEAMRGTSGLRDSRSWTTRATCARL